MEKPEKTDSIFSVFSGFFRSLICKELLRHCSQITSEFYVPKSKSDCVVVSQQCDMYCRRMHVR